MTNFMFGKQKLMKEDFLSTIRGLDAWWWSLKGHSFIVGVGKIDLTEINRPHITELGRLSSGLDMERLKTGKIIQVLSGIG